MSAGTHERGYTLTDRSPLPIGLAMGLGMSPTLLVVAGLGVLGLGTAPFWTRALGRVLRWQRHAMAAGFRGE
jgi:hypothetical protein